MQMRRGLVCVMAVTVLCSAPAHGKSPTGNGTESAAPTTSYVDVICRFQNGAFTVEQTTRGRFDAPTRVPRYLGRFEARILRAGKVVDALRFDFPLLGDADAGNEGALDQKLRAHASAKTRVRIPLPEGATAIAFVDLRAGENAKPLFTIDVPKAQPLLQLRPESPAPKNAPRPDGGA